MAEVNHLHSMFSLSRNHFLRALRFVYKEEEEEMVDHQEVLKEACSEQPKCSKLKELLDSCNERVENAEETEEECTEELYDFVHCVDHCVSLEVDVIS